MDLKYLELCDYISDWSNDTARKVGTVIVKDDVIVSLGYNCFPSGVKDNIEQRYERPVKYFFTEHAERNAIFHAAKTGVGLKGAVMYLRWFPCADCARAIVQSGITTVVCSKPKLDHVRWGESFKKALLMFNECKIKLIYHG